MKVRGEFATFRLCLAINYAYTSVPYTAVLCKIMEHIKEYYASYYAPSYLRTNMDFGKIIHVTLN